MITDIPPPLFIQSCNYDKNPSRTPAATAAATVPMPMPSDALTPSYILSPYIPAADATSSLIADVGAMSPGALEP